MRTKMSTLSETAETARAMALPPTLAVVGLRYDIPALQWVCELCTHFNSPSVSLCTVCGTFRAEGGRFEGGDQHIHPATSLSINPGFEASM